MRHLQNEEGNAAFYLLWLLGIVALIFVLTINIVKVYIVKEHANLAVEQAALAGTAVILEKTKEAVKDFDTCPTKNPWCLTERELHKVANGGKSVGFLIEKKKADYINGGMDEADAYIKASNEILPKKVNNHHYLKKILRDKLGDSRTDAYYIYSSAIMNIIDQNKARTEDTEIEISNDDWRIEVKSTVSFETVSDNKYISKFIDKIPQKGYGPTLSYLEDVYTGSIIFPDL